MSIQLIPHKPDHIIGLNINGSIDSEDIDRMAKLMEKRFSRGEKLRVYAEVNNWSGMSLSAFVKDLRFSLQHLNDVESEAGDHRQEKRCFWQVSAQEVFSKTKIAQWTGLKTLVIKQVVAAFGIRLLTAQDFFSVLSLLTLLIFLVRFY